MLYKRRSFGFVEDEGAEGEAELKVNQLCRGQEKEMHFPQLESCAIGVKWPQEPQQALCVMNIFL